MGDNYEPIGNFTGPVAPSPAPAAPPPPPPPPIPPPPPPVAENQYEVPKYPAPGGAVPVAAAPAPIPPPPPPKSKKNRNKSVKEHAKSGTQSTDLQSAAGKTPLDSQSPGQPKSTAGATSGADDQKNLDEKTEGATTVDEGKSKMALGGASGKYSTRSVGQCIAIIFGILGLFLFGAVITTPYILLGFTNVLINWDVAVVQ